MASETEEVGGNREHFGHLWGGLFISMAMPADSRCEKTLMLCLNLQVQNCDKAPVQLNRA